MSDAEERMRILKMIEGGQLSAEDGSRLLEALDEERPGEIARERQRPRTLRIRITDVGRGRSKVEVRIPTSLIDVGLKMGARLAPRVEAQQLVEIMRAIERGATGRVFEMQDLDQGERIEVYVE